MSTEIKLYPSVISRPYMLIESADQKKDMQRFWFENTMSFLSIIASSNLVKSYNELKAKDKLSDKETKILTDLQNHKSLTSIGLEHMSLGKWVGSLRESIKAFNNSGFNNTIYKDLNNFYKKQEKNIDSLVTTRNADAHGEPIPEDKLEAELLKRQKIVNDIMDSLNFLEKYEIILPEKLEIENGQPVYLSKIFKGNETINTKILFPFNPNIGEVILCDENKKEVLNLSPYLLYLGVEHNDKNFLGIFSSYSNKEQTIAKYLNLDGSANIDFNTFSKSNGSDFIKLRQSFVEIYSDPEKYTPNFNIKLVFEEKSIDVNTDSSFKLILDNTKSIDIENLNVVVNIPLSIKLKVSDDVIFKNGKLELNIPKLENELLEKEFHFEAQEQGTFLINSGFCNFDFFESDSNKESSQYTSTDIDLIGGEVECNDPNSRDKMIPVINISRKFVNEKGENISNAKIGDEFIFNIDIKNIGFSSARNVTIDLRFPDDMLLQDGKETILLSDLNPNETKTFQYVLTSKIPNIYNITMQNIIYFDLNDKKYVTQCADDYYIVIRSDLKKEFTYKIEDFLDDLYIDKEENIVIEKEIENLKLIDDNALEFYKKSETDAVIKNVRKIIIKALEKNGLKLHEFIYEEGLRDAKITNLDQRKFLVFSVGKFPFFAINLSKGYNPTFHALNSKIGKIKNYKVLEEFSVVANSYTLDHTIEYEKIKFDEEYGKDFFTTWINQLVNRIQNQYLVWGEMTDLFDEYTSTINGTFLYGSGAFYKEIKKIDNEGSVNQLATYINRVSNSIYIAFRNTSSSTYTEMIKKYAESTSNIIFLRPSSKERNFYKNDEICYYSGLSEDPKKPSRIVAIEHKLGKSFNKDEMMDEVKNLWQKLCHIHSYEIINSLNIKNENIVDLFTSFINKLYEKGFSLRENEKNPTKMIEIYPLSVFNPHSATTEDAIAFIDSKNLKFQLKFYSNKSNSELMMMKNDLYNYNVITCSAKEDEEFIDVFNIILENIDLYSKSKKQVIPDTLQQEFLLGMGQNETGFFILLKCLYQGINNYSEIAAIFDETIGALELKRLGRLEKSFQKENLEPIFYFNDDLIELNNNYKFSLDLLGKEDNTFNYLKGTAYAYKRVKTKKIAHLYNGLNTRTPHSNGELYHESTMKNKPFKKYWKSIKINSKEDIIFEVTLKKLVNEKTVEELNKLFVYLETDDRGEYHTNYKAQNQFYTLEFFIKTRDDIELQNLCKEFFEKIDQIIEAI